MDGPALLFLTAHSHPCRINGNTAAYSLVETPAKVEAANCLRYSLPQTIPAEGSHNGSAAVLKTAVRKDMQVRVLSPPPFDFFGRQFYSSPMIQENRAFQSCSSLRSNTPGDSQVR